MAVFELSRLSRGRELTVRGVVKQRIRLAQSAAFESLFRRLGEFGRIRIHAAGVTRFAKESLATLSATAHGTH
jgi:hypothetical protein